MTVRPLLLAQIDQVASIIGDLANELVFVGGTAIALYPLRPGVNLRPTIDVDCIVDADLASYGALQQRLRRLGFKDARGPGDPLCRMLHGDLVLDVMPVCEEVLGFSNRWYQRSIETACWYELPSGRQIRAARPALLAATKIEAFYGRGNGDYMASHDLEDLLALLSGDRNLLEQIGGTSDESEPEDAIAYLRHAFTSLASDPEFLAAVPAHFPGDAAGTYRAQEIVDLLLRLARTA